jgi:zinc and cadmium transporter
MPLLAQALLATFFVSTISLVGIVLILAGRGANQGGVVFLSFAAGVLLATALLELFPEAIEKAAGNGGVFAAALGAMVGFFLLERVLHGSIEHQASPAFNSRYLILIGGGLHNFIDGIVIGASFLVNPALGLATTIAVAAHEIPREFADYGILVSCGFRPPVALLLNFLSGLVAMLGCFASLSLGFVDRHVPLFLAATAGMFLYIAGSNLIPELHHSRHHGSWACTLPFLGGVGLTAVGVNFLG